MKAKLFNTMVVLIIMLFLVGVVSAATDTDGDGYTVPEDCSESNENVNPGAFEVCFKPGGGPDGTDDNCNGQVDEFCDNLLFYLVMDGDTDDKVSSTPATVIGDPAGVSYKPSKFGQSVQFAGSYLNYGPAVMNIGDNQDFTVSAWVKTTDPSGKATLIQKKETMQPGYEVFFNTGRLAGEFQDNQDGMALLLQSAPMDMNDNVWHHVVWVFDRDQEALYYIDGIPQNDDMVNFADEARDLSNAASFFVAGSSLTSYTGYIDELRIFNYALTSTEVSSLFTMYDNVVVPTEICDNIDNDNDFIIDEGCDDDLDNYPDETLVCSGVWRKPSGGTQPCPGATGNDCDDTKDNVNPGITEGSDIGRCNDGLDNDCDGLIDDQEQACDGWILGVGCGPQNFQDNPNVVDTDGDGYVGNNPSENVNNCDCVDTIDELAAAGMDANNEVYNYMVGQGDNQYTDLEDFAAGINPGVIEDGPRMCNDGIDNNCNGNIDDAYSNTDLCTPISMQTPQFSTNNLFAGNFYSNTMLLDGLMDIQGFMRNENTTPENESLPVEIDDDLKITGNIEIDGDLTLNHPETEAIWSVSFGTYDCVGGDCDTDLEITCMENCPGNGIGIVIPIARREMGFFSGERFLWPADDERPCSLYVWRPVCCDTDNNGIEDTTFINACGAEADGYTEADCSDGACPCGTFPGDPDESVDWSSGNMPNNYQCPT